MSFRAPRSGASNPVATLSFRAPRSGAKSLGTDQQIWVFAPPRRTLGSVQQYYVYLMTNKSGTLYTGVTNNLERRVSEHKRGLVKGFTSRYRISSLVYYETFNDIRRAIEREKRIKGWSRAKRVALIDSANPGWEDLSAGWFDSEWRGGEAVEERVTAKSRERGRDSSLRSE